MNDGDVFGVVREHRWMSADEQADMLRASDPSVIYTLDGGKKLPACTIRNLEQWATAPGRVFRVFHAFLLVEPAKHTRTMRDRLRALVHEIVDKRGAVIEDVYAGLSTAHPGQRRAMEAMAREMIARSCQGARSVVNGQRTRGRQLVEFTRAQLAEAKRIWRDTVEYPRWEDADVALAKIRSAKGEPFTRYRARKMWRARKSKGK